MVENTKQKLIREIASAFLPLQTALSDNSAFEESMLKLGWGAPNNSYTHSELRHRIKPTPEFGLFEKEFSV